MSRKNLVSVIIPAYNASSFLAESVESVLRQTYQSIECIIIDDYSSDDTWKIIKQYAAKDSRIRAYRNESNLGVGATRSRGITLAKGQFICWQDADDVSVVDRISQQLEYLISHPDVGIVGGWMEFFGEGTKPSVRRYAEEDTALRRNIFRYNPVAQPAAMVQRKCYDKVGLYDESYVVDEDLEMLFRLGTEYKFANVQDVVLRYRQSKNSLTRSKLRLMELTTIALRREYAKQKAYQANIGDYVYNVLQYMSIYFIPPKLKITIFNYLRNS